MVSKDGGGPPRHLRVCHVITGFDTGGAERMLLQTAARLDPSRFHSLIVSLRDRGPLSAEADRSGVETIHLGMGRRPGPATLWQLARTFRRKNVAVVHAYLYDASIASRLAGRWARVPVVLTSTRASLEYLPRAAWWLDRLTARWCQRIIAVSRGTAEFIVHNERIPESKVVVLPNGVDLRHYRPGDHAAARARWAIPDDGFVVASIGRLHPQKGHRFLLEALARIRHDIPGLVCIMAGDGQLRDELIHYASLLGLADCCRFLGAVADSRSVYDAADVTVLASLYEGMPNVVLEAMAMACPVLATKVQGTVDLVRPGETGLLVPPGDAVALAEGLRELAADSRRRRAMGARSRRLAEAHHGIDKMVASLEALYLREWAQSSAARQSWFRKRSLR